MPARLFLSTWTGAAGGEVKNPIVDYVGTLPNDGYVAMFYGDADGNGLPDFPLVLVLVYSKNYTGAQIETIASNVAGVHLVPPLRWTYPLSDIPLAKLQAARTYLNNNGIDTSALTLSNTYGDLVKLIVQAIAPAHAHGKINIASHARVMLGQHIGVAAISVEHPRDDQRSAIPRRPAAPIVTPG